jgi:hypothetical protein
MRIVMEGCLQNMRIGHGETRVRSRSNERSFRSISVHVTVVQGVFLLRINHVERRWIVKIVVGVIRVMGTTRTSRIRRVRRRSRCIIRIRDGVLRESVQLLRLMLTWTSFVRTTMEGSSTKELFEGPTVAVDMKVLIHVLTEGRQVTVKVVNGMRSGCQGRSARRFRRNLVLKVGAM